MVLFPGYVQFNEKCNKLVRKIFYRDSSLLRNCEKRSISYRCSVMSEGIDSR